MEIYSPRRLTARNRSQPPENRLRHIDKSRSGCRWEVRRGLQNRSHKHCCRRNWSQHRALWECPQRFGSSQRNRRQCQEDPHPKYSSQKFWSWDSSVDSRQLKNTWPALWGLLYGRGGKGTAGPVCGSPPAPPNHYGGPHLGPVLHPEVDVHIVKSINVQVTWHIAVPVIKSRETMDLEEVGPMVFTRLNDGPSGDKWRAERVLLRYSGIAGTQTRARL